MIKKPRVMNTLFLAGGLAAALILVQTSAAQVEKGKTRPMLTSHLMSGLNKVHFGALRKGLGAAPATDEAWDDLVKSAALLNEASYILMADGRCPDGIWADAATKNLREGSAAVLTAIEARDLEAAKKGVGTIGQACKSCHDAHRKDE